MYVLRITRANYYNWTVRLRVRVICVLKTPIQMTRAVVQNNSNKKKINKCSPLK